MRRFLSMGGVSDKSRATDGHAAVPVITQIVGRIKPTSPHTLCLGTHDQKHGIGQDWSHQTHKPTHHDQKARVIARYGMQTPPHPTTPIIHHQKMMDTDTSSSYTPPRWLVLPQPGLGVCEPFVILQAV
eukprot:scaffold85160_cov79-Cyclotella_meneghiniana.AAC.1